VDSDTVWRALASPHRRKLLDLLRNGPSTTGELVRQLPGLSRFAVMQHLEVLEAAGLVLYRREGRRRLNFANPIPLREIYERWVSKPASSAAETDLHLKRYAEREVANHMQNTEFRLVKIETELRINAPREKVFAAFFEDYDKWWPHRYYPDSRCSVDDKPGGYIYEHFPNGGGAITGTVVYIDRPSKFAGSSPSSLGRGTNSYAVQSFEDDGSGGTIVKRSMELWGNVSEEVETMFREGSRHLMEVALLGYLEKGALYQPEAQS
jgi:DNA-binding transcriptional ArsR family regulator/uncharacterized protein YndB with AHSA1/START domain